MLTSIYNRLREDTNLALKQREKERVSALRLILAEMKRVEVDEREEISDVRALQILDKMTKQRKDSYAQFFAAGRNDLADQEKFEIDRPEQVIDYLGMMGDAVDNIPGLPGVGDKTAKKFLKEFSNLLETSRKFI